MTYKKHKIKKKMKTKKLKQFRKTKKHYKKFNNKLRKTLNKKGGGSRPTLAEQCEYDWNNSDDNVKNNKNTHCNKFYYIDTSINNPNRKTAFVMRTNKKLWGKRCGKVSSFIKKQDICPSTSKGAKEAENMNKNSKPMSNITTATERLEKTSEYLRHSDPTDVGSDRFSSDSSRSSQAEGLGATASTDFDKGINPFFRNRQDNSI